MYRADREVSVGRAGRPRGRRRGRRGASAAGIAGRVTAAAAVGLVALSAGPAAAAEPVAQATATALTVTVASTPTDSGAYAVRDDGSGLPQGFDPARATGLGMRIVTAFAQQLGAELEARDRAPGTEFALLIPLRPQERPR